MPIFEYTCKKCGTSFEALVSVADAKAPCEKCGSTNVKKQLSTFSASVTTESSPCIESGCGKAGTGCGGGCPMT